MTTLPKSTLYTLIVLAVGMVLGLVILKSKPKPEPKDVPSFQPPMVSVLDVQTGQHSLQVKTQGTIQPRREIDLVAQVGGKVVAVADDFADGGFFEQGEKLVQIEDSDYRFALSRAEAKVAEAQQLLATEKGRARQAKREWRELGNREANDLFLRKPQLAAAKAGLDAAKADRDQARLNLQRTQVTTPFKGRVRETHVDLGQYINTGNRVARYYATDVVEVRLPLSDRQVALLDLPLGYQEDDQALALSVTLNAVFGGKNWQWPGKVMRTDASIDVESRMVYAVAEIANPFAVEENSKRPPLTIGQFVEATINGKTFDNVMVLPRTALQADNKIWRVGKDNRLQQVSANILQAGSETVAVQLDNAQLFRIVVSIMPVAVAGMQVEPEPLAELTESADKK